MPRTLRSWPGAEAKTSSCGRMRLLSELRLFQIERHTFQSDSESPFIVVREFVLPHTATICRVTMRSRARAYETWEACIETMKSDGFARNQPQLGLRQNIDVHPSCPPPPHDVSLITPKREPVVDDTIGVFFGGDGVISRWSHQVFFI